MSCICGKEGGGWLGNGGGGSNGTDEMGGCGAGVLGAFNLIDSLFITKIKLFYTGINKIFWIKCTDQVKIEKNWSILRKKILCFSKIKF